jgi:hypothetical protein
MAGQLRIRTMAVARQERQLEMALKPARGRICQEEARVVPLLALGYGMADGETALRCFSFLGFAFGGQ